MIKRSRRNTSPEIEPVNFIILHETSLLNRFACRNLNARSNSQPSRYSVSSDLLFPRRILTPYLPFSPDPNHHYNSSLTKPQKLHSDTPHFYPPQPQPPTPIPPPRVPTTRSQPSFQPPSPT